MTSYLFFNMAAAFAQYYFRFRICMMSLPSEGQNLSTNQISSTSMVNIYQYMAEI